MSNPDDATHDEFYKSLLGDFLGESEQLLVALNENLLRLDQWVRSLRDDREQPCAENLLGELFRSAHSLKGLSNMLGLDEIEHVVGLVEKVLDAARRDKLVITGGVVELMFAAIDRVANLIDALKDPDAPAVQYESVTEQLSQLLRSGNVGQEPSDQTSVEDTLGAIESHVADVLTGMTAPTAMMDALKGTPPSGGSTPPKTTDPGADRARNVDEPDSAATPPRIGGQTVDVADATASDTSQTGDESEELFDGLTDEADMSSRFLSIFIDETELALDQVTETLLALERGGSRDELKHLLVISHRIKGSAASIGLNRTAKLSHLMEDLLQDLIDAGKRLSTEATDAMLRSVDALRQYVEGLKKGSIPTDHFGQLAGELLRARQGPIVTNSELPSAPDGVGDPGRNEVPEASLAGSSEDPATLESASTARGAEASCDAACGPAAGPTGKGSLIPISGQLREAVITTAPIGLPVFAGVATFQPDLPLVGLKAELLYEKLSSLGDVCYSDPSPDQFDAIEKLDCIRFGLATERSEQQIHRALRTAGIVGAVIEPLFYGASDGADVCDDTEQEVSPSSASVALSLGPTPDSAAPRPAAPVQPSRSAKQGVGAGSATRSAHSSGKPAETLRVDIDRLDQLMNLAGQLVVSKARFAQISDRLRTVFGNKRSILALSNVLDSLVRMADLDEETDEHQTLQAELGTICTQARRIQGQLEPIERELESFYEMHASINELEEAVHQLERVSDEIQKNVMDTRMVPIGPLFTRFHRVLRDITRASGKSIRLEIHGENTELDKRMIDELGDPLIHMVRNAADHGIEPSEARLRAGKPPEGTVTLDACHRGNSIFIQISDDGKGLDPNHILAKALEKGIVNGADVEQMTTYQIYQLIWKSGFSTAGRVTEVSGRGMGMDIVQSRVEALNGAVELESTPGQGTTITVKLPLTLAILPSLMVDIGGDVFAMPMESVAEIVSVPASDVATVHGKRTAQVRGRVVSIVQLDEVFQWNGGASRGADRSVERSTLVIVCEGDQEIGLAVDRVIGEEDVVIKSMADNYKNVRGVAGASVLGDGRVSLILDLATVITMSARPSSAVTVS